ncbi:CHAT domain-containing protein [Fusarium redolens]|uniref:CHAT domain-containing protein n=1 Tax=Fusarium redolens TaxID=48865 RepID=A0A9P9KBQ7_FUSRE|nr:CHAT domain-containing protein [Fusarium redolens]KAH7255313.1 CHAT domain-containing protein [Fusarium redolens]
MPDRIHTVPLVDLSRASIEQKVLTGERGSPDVLEWLWDTIVCPVLDRIGFSETPTGDNWPQVWWIPTGILKQFPLHAAGCHRKKTNESTLDRVVSSYASSVKAMIQARKRRMSTRETNKAVLVAMETTPTLSRLAFANQELEVVKDVCSSIGLEGVEPERRKAALIDQLRQCKFFHFAGHGCTDPQDPLRSYLCLEDVVTNPLRVGGLLDLNLKDQPPFLAYLSACGTGRIQQEQFMDESVHLISAFQLAGFQHVIGTLWEVNDKVCVDIAKVAYEGIRDGQMTDLSVAWGLHEASRQLRDKWLEKMDQEGHRRGDSDNILNSLIIREPAVHGIRWETRRIRRRVQSKGMSISLGTRWRRVATKASRSIRVSSGLMSGITTRGQRWSREASLAILLRHKIEPSPAWVPFIHYGI